jgi:arabinogalactan endo-1,4-beta-galactosidase
MRQAMYDYVSRLMNVLKTAHVTPAWVKLGNETNRGICLPTGSLSGEPAQMTGLLNAAYEMVKEVFPSAQTIIHLARPKRYDVVTAFLDAYVANGGNWDITGFSSYVSGPSTIDTIVANYVRCAKTYGKPVMQVQFGGLYDHVGRACTDHSYFIRQNHANGVLGFFYWEPDAYLPFDD